MNTEFFPVKHYYFLFSVLGLVYLTGLFVPLMDNDAAHHANIALHMYLHNDYVNLVSSGKNYLDKPHLLFWLAAASYKLFGVTGFAYKFPSFCVTIFGTWCIYRLGKTLYNKETGKLSALVAASAFGYMLANSDVRMDAMLTGFIVFATWQGVELVRHSRIINALGLGLGLSLAFSTKGHIGLFTPLVGLFAYSVYLKRVRLFLDYKWLVVLLVCGILITPVVYCYYQQYNLHPERTVNGVDNINGVRFILFGQVAERFFGREGKPPNKDLWFFFHAFPWAFAPWALVTGYAFFLRIKHIGKRSDEWLTIGTITVFVLLLSFSANKLPHYLNIIFPVCAILTAAVILDEQAKHRVFSLLLYTACIVIFLVFFTLNTWAFPVTSRPVIVLGVAMLAVTLFYLVGKKLSLVQRSIGCAVCLMATVFLVLNLSFYPKLLAYQSGKNLADKIKPGVDPGRVYYWNGRHNSSFAFYTATLRRQFDDSLFIKEGASIWVLFRKDDTAAIRKSGYAIGRTFSAVDYRVSMLKPAFINPATRPATLDEVFLGEFVKTPGHTDAVRAW